MDGSASSDSAVRWAAVEAAMRALPLELLYVVAPTVARSAEGPTRDAITITRQSGKRKIAHARFVHNDRLVDALMSQAQSALLASPGARAYYDKQRARGLDHHAALRQLANRLVGILHGCLKTRTLYDEATAWSHHNQDQRTAA